MIKPPFSPRRLLPIFAVSVFATLTFSTFANADPATEPTVIAVKKVMPAVVNISTESIIRRSVQADPYDLFFNRFFGSPQLPPRQYAQKMWSLGSGFIIDPQGDIVTNAHVLSRSADDFKIHVTTSDGKTYVAHFIDSNPKTDLALIKIDGKKPFPFIDINKPSPSLLGENVLALGNPLGYGNSVSRGIISALDRSVSAEHIKYKDLVQTDAAINPGNSGGPLIDLDGKLVGINSVKMAYTPRGVPTQGIGFAIPVSIIRKQVAEFRKVAKTLASEPKNASRVTRLFGLQLQNLTPALSSALGYEIGSGVLISDVESNSPAAKAGIKRGLVIYKIGNYRVRTMTQVNQLLTHAHHSGVVSFTVGAIKQNGGQNIERVRTVNLKAR